MLDRLRWHVACAINHVVWWIMPEPMRSRIRKDFGEVYGRWKMKR